MLALLDNGQDLDKCAAEIGGGVGQLLTPLTRYSLRDPDQPWAIDNGGFKRLDIPAFRSLLQRENHHREKCLFVAVPDIVGSAQRTLELFELWFPLLARWKIAYVCQDGQENLPIPWSRIDAIFIGGSTSWKCSIHVERIIRVAKIYEKWVHIGRVNTPERWSHFEEMGADSADGTGLARYSHMREAIAKRHNSLSLFSQGVEL